MQKYTTLLKTICEVCTNAQKTDKIDTIVTNAIPYIFDFNFPFYSSSETILKDWEKRFIKYFYMREIGLETVNLWKFELDNKLNLIMPMYNKMYSKLLVDFDPIITENITEIRNATGAGTATTKTTGTDNSTTENSGNSEMTHSTLPQSSLANFRDNKYLDEASKNTTENSTTTNAVTTGNTEGETTQKDFSELTIKGVRGYNPSDLYSKYLEFISALGNIDQRVYDDCEDLFMSLF